MARPRLIHTQLSEQAEASHLIDAALFEQYAPAFVIISPCLPRDPHLSIYQQSPLPCPLWATVRGGRERRPEDSTMQNAPPHRRRQRCIWQRQRRTSHTLDTRGWTRFRVLTRVKRVELTVERDGTSSYEVPRVRVVDVVPAWWMLPARTQPSNRRPATQARRSPRPRAVRVRPDRPRPSPS